MPVDVWSDVVCPWCCIGRAHLRQALEQFEHADEVTVTWRSYELDPHAPAIPEDSLTDQLARKYGVGPVEVESMFDDVRERGAAAGVDLRFDIAKSGNTFDAHRLLHLARTTGLEEALTDRFFRAYFSEGEAIGDPAVLARLATEIGISPDAVREVLDTDAFAADVRAEEATAQRLGVTGVPFFVIDQRYGVAGAQPVGNLLAALRQAWADRDAQRAV